MRSDAGRKFVGMRAHGSEVCRKFNGRRAYGSEVGAGAGEGGGLGFPGLGGFLLGVWSRSLLVRALACSQVFAGEAQPPGARMSRQRGIQRQAPLVGGARPAAGCHPTAGLPTAAYQSGVGRKLCWSEVGRKLVGSWSEVGRKLVGSRPEVHRKAVPRVGCCSEVAGRSRRRAGPLVGSCSEVCRAWPTSDVLPANHSPEVHRRFARCRSVEGKPLHRKSPGTWREARALRSELRSGARRMEARRKAGPWVGSWSEVRRKAGPSVGSRSESTLRRWRAAVAGHKAGLWVGTGLGVDGRLPPDSRGRKHIARPAHGAEAARRRGQKRIGSHARGSEACSGVGGPSG